MKKINSVLLAAFLVVSCDGGKTGTDNDDFLDDGDNSMIESDAVMLTDADGPSSDKKFEIPDDPGEQQYAAALADTGRENDFAVSDPAGNGEKIVTDGATGLVWQQVVPTIYPGCVKVDMTGLSCTWPEAIEYCDTLVYGGSDDWHLPTPHELLTIVDYGKIVDIGQDDAATYSNAFPGMKGGSFWTSLYETGVDWLAGYPAWTVNFSYGRVSTHGSYGSSDDDPKSFGDKVICVRRDGVVSFSGTRYAETTGNDGKIIVTDNLTKLEWTKEYVENKTQEEATVYCADLVYEDKEDWRLPGLNELRSLIDYTKENPASNFPGITAFATDDRFWTARSHAGDDIYSWFLGFDAPYLDFIVFSEPPYYFNVRCVR